MHPFIETTHHLENRSCSSSRRVPDQPRRHSVASLQISRYLHASPARTVPRRTRSCRPVCCSASEAAQFSPRIKGFTAVQLSPVSAEVPLGLLLLTHLSLLTNAHLRRLVLRRNVRLCRCRWLGCHHQQHCHPAYHRQSITVVNEITGNNDVHEQPWRSVSLKSTADILRSSNTATCELRYCVRTN